MLNKKLNILHMHFKIGKKLSPHGQGKNHKFLKWKSVMSDSLRPHGL